MDIIFFLEIALKVADKREQEFLRYLIGMALIEAHEIEGKKPSGAVLN